MTATDTGVGKTVVTCAIAAALRKQLAQATDAGGTANVRLPSPGRLRRPPSPGGRGGRVGVCKPFATGCRKDREGLVSEDAEALAHFADCRQPLDIINPVRYLPPMAPAMAAQATGTPIDFAALSRSLQLLDETSDAVLVEGVGGLLVPIDGNDPQVTVLDLIRQLGYPVVVVTRAGLGTLNHTALTVRLLQQARCKIAGLVVNGYEPDVAKVNDPAMPSNREWLMKMTRLPILATVPVCPADEVAPQRGTLPPAVLDAVALTYWPDVLGVPVGPAVRSP